MPAEKVRFAVPVHCLDVTRREKSDMSLCPPFQLPKSYPIDRLPGTARSNWPPGSGMPIWLKVGHDLKSVGLKVRL